MKGESEGGRLRAAEFVFWCFWGLHFEGEADAQPIN